MVFLGKNAFFVIKKLNNRVFLPLLFRIVKIFSSLSMIKYRSVKVCCPLLSFRGDFFNFFLFNYRKKITLVKRFIKKWLKMKKREVLHSVCDIKLVLETSDVTWIKKEFMFDLNFYVVDEFLTRAVSFL